MADKQEAEQRGFSFVGSFGEGDNYDQLDETWPPYIDKATLAAPVNENGEAIIQAKVYNNTPQVKRVWAAIYPPSYRPTLTSSEIVLDSPPTVVLSQRSTNLFEVPYKDFDEIGVYRVVVMAEDNAGIEARPKVIEVLTLKGAGVIEEMVTHTLTFTDTQGVTLTLEAAPQTVTSSTVLQFAEFQTLTHPLPQGLSFAQRGFKLEAYQYGQKVVGSFGFSLPVTVTVNYRDEEITGLNEDKLAIRYWTGSDWSTEGITIIERKPEQNQLVISLTHLTEFALFGPALAKTYLPILLK